ncbi:non-hydrolyzing UDP-N-acetylglucosamine 2-epimerase [[Clostridium] hylemonae]|uniref:UDP-N-acetylglucosamine 2-epimerase n=1 Tax=[Clostridium] hylemonae DSM 15053 TaxID=553973 RepID=C0C2C6_9FIRM|nr:UDP-N-acetylglucosamine 2-epimerase (non-hydrolyzing) [[Clostridium] hylemonae]EEG73550.1 UDP-N-acetylglucosamine 2-epimerase [[Clostridium] hylemonae DSM 15053]QEK17151.1 UDP-2,3-diacetamido-2,3-dideoxy-D-glucuronate 2-epimerase [[Clostridium] hylemonae DSM 15053]
MKIVTIVGARPQFVKAAAVSRILRKTHEEVLVHTGQHYDRNMSEIFFDELNIPKPDINLRVGSGTHAKQTAEMLIGIENILLKEKPDYILVYGDTNSTLAGALAASKINVPVIHVEAGLRSYNMKMPEEQNRVLTDRISSLLLCPTSTAVDNLKKEGIVSGVYNIGDVMCDAVLYYSKMLDERPKEYYFSRLTGLDKAVPLLKDWYIATVHRAENTDMVEKVGEILRAFDLLDAPVIFPVHPRTKDFVNTLRMNNFYDNIFFVEPVSYLDMLYLVKGAKKAITDSGGLQKEAYILNTPCVTIRDQTEWIETLTGNHNILAKPKADDIVDKVMYTVIDEKKSNLYYGNGKAAEKLCEILYS